jgi:hypothetical protein
VYGDNATFSDQEHTQRRWVDERERKQAQEQDAVMTDVAGSSLMYDGEILGESGGTEAEDGGGPIGTGVF